MSVIKIIAAIAENGVIGNGNKIPWHISDEFKHFKRTTMGGIIVFGRRTWESIGAKALPGRENAVISSAPEKIAGAKAFRSLEDAVAAYKSDPRDLWICGGASLYKQALPICSELVLSKIKDSPEGDAFFPKFDDRFAPAETLLAHELFEVIRYVPKGA